MKLHILGICGTFMGGLAILAKQLNYTVSGSDSNVYPPMSTQLESQGIKLIQGFEENQLDQPFDEIVVGNVMRRGLPVIEALLNRGIPMISGPEWLARHVLVNRHVLAVSGTHGKTTTASMLAWILDYAGLNPGFLIGGVPNNFSVSARLGGGRYFVVEADEYDSAFFDKRSKFIHYRPRTLIINNIEFDHADIFKDLEAIQNQFHHLIRTIPNQGLIVIPASEDSVNSQDPINQVLQKGCWTPISTFSSDSVEFSDPTNSSSEDSSSQFSAIYKDDQTSFDVLEHGKICGTVKWTLLGTHNISNALAAIAAASHVGVKPETAIEALCQFQGVKRRLEVKGLINNITNIITVYDDFAHHPTAIKTTLEGLRLKLGKKANIVAVVDIRSNTMKAGHHQEELASSVLQADSVYFFKSPDILWDVKSVWAKAQKPGGVYEDYGNLLKDLLRDLLLSSQSSLETHLVFMSNGGFGGIHNEFLENCRKEKDLLVSHA